MSTVAGLIFTNAPYRMVFVNVSLLFLYCFVIYFYIHIFPKKNISYFILLITLSILPTLSIFRQGTYESGDLTIHTARLVSFYNNLYEGIFVPRWAAELNATYGYSLFSFIYPLPYYISSFFHFIGFSFLDSVKTLLVFTYIFSGLSVFIWLKHHFSEKNSFWGSIFYLFAPYHLVDMHFRVDIGEMTALLFLPLNLYLIDKILIKGQYLYILLGGIVTALLILSHPSIAITGFCLLCVYIVFIKFKKSITHRIEAMYSLVIGLLFSAYYWLPIFVEAKYTYGSIVNTTLEFYPLKNFIYSPWRYGLLFQGPNGELSFVVGYAHLIVIFVTIYLILKRKKRYFSVLFFSLFLIFFLLMQSISKPLWDVIIVLNKMLLTYRLLAPIILTTSALAAYCSSYLKNIYVYFLLLVVIGTSILNWGNRRNIPQIKDPEIIKQLPTISSEGECFWPAIHISSQEADFCRKNIPTSTIESIDGGKFQIINLIKNTNYHYYLIESEYGGNFKENTDYFPGWKLFINGKENNINYLNPQFPGIITFNLPKGINTIELKFEDTNLRRFAFLISFVSFVLSGFYLLKTSIFHK